MRSVLATTFHPRGETGRLERAWSQICALYDDVIISLPPSIEPEDALVIRGLGGVKVHVNGDWSHGRYMALKLSLETAAECIHYVDMDRLLRWIETRPDELVQIIDQIKRCECLVIGRTAAAWDTHPQSMRQTEAISSRLFSGLLGQELDLSAGSKGFSRAAVAFLMANTKPGQAIGTDSEWVVLCHRGGFKVESVLVDGLDWEIADRYQSGAADAVRQREIRDAYDADPQNWAHRVRIAQEIVDAGMDALGRVLA